MILNVFSKAEQGITDQEIEKLLCLKVIRVTHRQDEQILSPHFLEEEKEQGPQNGDSFRKTEQTHSF